MRPRASHFLGKAVGIALLMTATGVLAPETAKAEGGLFGAIIDLLSGRAAQRPVEPLAVPAPNNTMPGAVPLAQESGNESSTKVAYCVRTCDGRYFPIAKSSASSPAKTCQSMCPAAETKIYSGSNIDTAYTNDGSKYSSLPNAYKYREHLANSCTCNGRSAAGNAAITIENDPTLRAGDIVMTANGPVVFTGAPGTHHKMSEFVPAQDSRKISRATRATVMAMKVMPTRQRVSTRKTPPQAEPSQRSASALPDGFGLPPKTRALSYSEQ